MTEFKNGTIFKVVDIEAMGMVENLGNDGLPDAWPWLMEALSMAVDADAVVPVEPDHEAMAEALWESETPLLGFEQPWAEQPREIKDEYREAAKRVWRAGIGDTT